MIVTVTPNPSLDRTLEVDVLARGEVVRANGSRLDAGGKGVNVARALGANGHAATAVFPCGGPDGEQLATLLATAPLQCRAVRIAHPIRSNVSITEPDGTVTKLNVPGPALSADELAALTGATVAAAGSATWVVGCGSLPPGAPGDWYGRLVHALRTKRVPVAVDTSGPALTAVLPHRPALIKPNVAELAAAAGRPVHTLAEALAAAQMLRERGAERVLASLGADGALLVADKLVLHGEAPVAAPRSSVGAGDALLAGFLSIGTAKLPEALAEALAWGAAAVALPGSRMPGTADLDRGAVHIHAQPDLDRPLRQE